MDIIYLNKGRLVLGMQKSLNYFVFILINNKNKLKTVIIIKSNELLSMACEKVKRTQIELGGTLDSLNERT